MEASSDFFGHFDTTHNANNVNNNNNNNNNSGCNHFVVDELLDFSKEDDDIMTDAFFDNLTGNSADSSTVTAVDSCNSSVSGGDTTTHFNGNLSCRSVTDAHFSGSELCVPYDDLAELEWLSNFMEDSLSSDELQSFQFIPTGKVPSATATDTSSASSINTTTRNGHNDAPLTNSPPPIFPSDVSVPGKARSKRSRAAPCDWSSRLLLLSPATSSSGNDDTNPTSVTSLVNSDPNPVKTKRRENTDAPGRKCLHCGSEKTPQWRTGPMGPKTLCNACGVRYKSGRLVPEYRPAASPTFVATKHSNSHRKVIELRRQKELQRQQAASQHLLGQNSIFGVSNGADDYLIHHQQQMHGHDDYRHMI